MQKEVTLRVEESIYKQFMGFIRLNKMVKVVSTPLPTVKHSGRRMRSHLPVVKAFIYDFDEDLDWRHEHLGRIVQKTGE